MSNGDFAPIQPARLHWQDRTPVARDFDDPYFSRQDGRAESRYVFLDGNRLSERFAALADGDRFVIGETGFGTGLNMLLAAALFRQRAPAGRGWICSRWRSTRSAPRIWTGRWRPGRTAPTPRSGTRSAMPCATSIRRPRRAATGCGWRTTSA